MGSAESWMGRRLSQLLGRPVEYDLAPYRTQLANIAALEPALTALSDAQLGERSRDLRKRVQDGERPGSLVPEAFALVRETARRGLNQRPFDEQMLAGLVLYAGRISELATGEGKTLAAVAPAYLHALSGQGAHVLTFNDYLARRDARWMGPIFERLDLSVGYVQEGMTPVQRRLAYDCDVTYVTAKEAGFDYLRDGLVLETADQVQRPFHFALVDEADSILIDEARVPLVIAGEAEESLSGPERIATVARQLRAGLDFDTDDYRHNIALTDTGTLHAESLLACGSLYAPENLVHFAQLRNALHAQHLLTRDVDYIVRRGKIELVDDFTGRVAERRQWPDGLQAAIEAKEGVRLQAEGRVLGSIALQHFLRLYPHLAGMTATAQPAAEELELFYGLRVVVVPTHRPMIRVDHPDVVFTHQDAKRTRLLAEIVATHRSGRPVLVGTASVSESEALAHELQRKGVTCQVLNAKNDETEADIVAQAGALGAVTIATNMAGRGTDIRLGGPDEAQRVAVAALGGLYVIGTHRHASRRIDQQLRGRAGRQGDPGASRFFVSLDDDLIRRYGVQNLISARHLPARQEEPVEGRMIRSEIARAQRIIEGETHGTQKALYAYSEPVEAQRRTIQARRRATLERTVPLDLLQERCAERYAALLGSVSAEVLRDVERRITLVVSDRCWSEYMAEARDMRDDSHLLAYGGKLPLAEFHRQIGLAFLALEDRLDDEIVRTFDALEITPQGVDWDAAGLRGPSATWTYLVGENPFGVSGYASPVHRVGLGLGAAILGPIFLLPKLGQLWKLRRGRKTRAASDTR
jgi:preprotein translocase subunit SecA